MWNFLIVQISFNIKLMQQFCCTFYLMFVNTR
uniref:Uncharacterized protein n=1 Tax=Rhizophora mucronata TaxID=61149 RepID=A0A2P2QZU8_RHIMU